MGIHRSHNAHSFHCSGFGFLCQVSGRLSEPRHLLLQQPLDLLREDRLELSVAVSGTTYACHFTRILCFLSLPTLSYHFKEHRLFYLQLVCHYKIICRCNASSFELVTPVFSQLINKQNLV